MTYANIPRENLTSAAINAVSSIDSSFVALSESWKPDVRPEHKSKFDSVADPVDIVTGAFYVDEVDLALPGPFPLEVRRNYNSQRPIPGAFGYGWKLSLNPHLIEEDDKIYAAEEDGTVIVISLKSRNFTMDCIAGRQSGFAQRKQEGDWRNCKSIPCIY